VKSSRFSEEQIIGFIVITSLIARSRFTLAIAFWMTFAEESGAAFVRTATQPPGLGSPRVAGVDTADHEIGLGQVASVSDMRRNPYPILAPK